MTTRTRLEDGGQKNKCWNFSTPESTMGMVHELLSFTGEAREVNMVPELAINARWRDIAFKIESFINTIPQCNNIQSQLFLMPG